MSNIDMSQMISAEDRAAAQAIADARRYLRETDWYITRQAETGVPIPDAVAQKRQAARAQI